MKYEVVADHPGARLGGVSPVWRGFHDTYLLTVC